MQNIKSTVIQRRASHLIVATALAVITSAILLLQLFHYETLATSIAVMLPAGIGHRSIVVAALIVVVELLATVYLLPVPISKLARACCGSAVIVAWLFWLVTITYSLLQGQTAPAAIVGSIGDTELHWNYLFFTAVGLSAGIYVILTDYSRGKILK